MERPHFPSVNGLLEQMATDNIQHIIMSYFDLSSDESLVYFDLYTMEIVKMLLQESNRLLFGY